MFPKSTGLNRCRLLERTWCRYCNYFHYYTDHFLALIYGMIDGLLLSLDVAMICTDPTTWNWLYTHIFHLCWHENVKRGLILSSSFLSMLNCVNLHYLISERQQGMNSASTQHLFLTVLVRRLSRPLPLKTSKKKRLPGVLSLEICIMYYKRYLALIRFRLLLNSLEKKEYYAGSLKIIIPLRRLTIRLTGARYFISFYSNHCCLISGNLSPVSY